MSTGPLRRARALGGAATLLVVAGLLVSCTVAGADPSDPAGSQAASAGTVEPSDRPGSDGPSPDELNDDILAAAATAAEELPLASVTAVATPQQVPTVLDVLEVRAVTEGTLVRMRLSSPDGEYTSSPTTFASGRFGTQNFVRDVYLDDPAGGTRYLPLQFEDYRAACVCPYLPFVVGAEPQEVHALFPPLPPGTGPVVLRLAGTDLVVEGLAVDG